MKNKCPYCEHELDTYLDEFTLRLREYCSSCGYEHEVETEDRESKNYNLMR